MNSVLSAVWVKYGVMGGDWCSKPNKGEKGLWWRQRAHLRGSDTPRKVVLYPFFLEARPTWAGMSRRPSQLHLAAKPSICKTANNTGNPKSQRNLKYYDLYNPQQYPQPAGSVSSWSPRPQPCEPWQLGSILIKKKQRLHFIWHVNSNVCAQTHVNTHRNISDSVSGAPEDSTGGPSPFSGMIYNFSTLLLFLQR